MRPTSKRWKPKLNDARSHDEKIIIIVGPNGREKPPARAFLLQEAQCPRFINADLIVAGLSPFAPEAAALKAGRLMLQRKISNDQSP